MRTLVLEIALVLLCTNLLHGCVALVWITGVRQVARPLPAALSANLLVLALLLPPVALFLQLAGVPPAPEEYRLLLDDFADPVGS